MCRFLFCLAISLRRCMLWRFSMVLTACLFVARISVAQLSVSPDEITHCTENDVTINASLNINTGGFVKPSKNSQDFYNHILSDIGFSFTFFGASYTQVHLSENNFITFNLNNFTTDPDSTKTSYTDYTTAHNHNGQFNNSILFPFQDLTINHDNKSDVNTATIGDEGSRQFIVEYCNIQLTNCSHLTSSSQVVLHEGTNIIDIHIINKPESCSQNSKTAILGIVKDVSTTYFVPGYDLPNISWALSNVSYRFTPQPNGTYAQEIIPFAPILIDFNPKYSDISWAAGSNPNVALGTGQNFTISTPNTEDYYICTYESTEGCLSETNVVYHDTIWLSVKESDTTLYDTICEQDMEDFSWHQHTVNTTGNHTLTFITPSLKNSCDSTVVLKLRVNPTIKKTVTQNACMNGLPTDAAKYNDNQPITETGTYQYIDTVPSLLTTCDSITTHILKVNDVISSDTTINICDSELPWTWHNIVIPQGGVYTQTLQTIHGCDSTTSLTVIVHPLYTVNLADTTLCESELPIEWNTQSITSAGTHELIDIQQTIFGCDSTTTRTFIVIPTILIEEPDTTLCYEHLPYTWHTTTTINEVGTGLYELADTITQNDNQCLHITTHKVSVVAQKKTVLYDTVCVVDLPYEWHGQTITQVGDFTLTHTTKSQTENDACDSIVVNYVRVQANYAVYKDSTICEQQIKIGTPFTWNGQTLALDLVGQTHIGIHEFTHTVPSLVTGCDSTTTLTLTVNPTLRTVVDTFICWEDNPNPYNWFEPHYMPIGSTNYTFIDTLHALTGCDSIVTLNIEMGFQRLVTHYGVCADELPFYHLNGDLVDADTPGAILVTDTITFHETHEPHTSVRGCDSTISVYWSVTQNFYKIIDTTIVCNQFLPFDWYIGDRMYHITAYSYFDDVLGEHVFHSDTYTKMATGECSEIEVRQLWMQKPDIDTLRDTICEMQLPYIWRDKYVINTTGYQVLWDTVPNAVTIFQDIRFPKCDSFYLLNLTVIPTLYKTIADTICQSELPYTWNNHVVEEIGSGQYVLKDTTTSSVSNCDSVTTLTLTIRPIFEIYLPDPGYPNEITTICQTDLPYNWNGLPIIEVGEQTLTAVLTTQYGCDSVIHVDFTVNPTLYAEDITFQRGWCIENINSFVPWKGNVFNEVGIFEFSDTTSSLVTSCDSITSITIVVNEAIVVALDSTVCTKNLPFIWENQTITQEGVHSLTALLEREITQCDSTVNLTVHVFPELSETLELVELCQADLDQTNGVYTWKDITVNEPGAYTLHFDTISALTQCDSTVYQPLIIHPTKHTKDSIHICDSDFPYEWFGQWITTPGLYDTTFHEKYSTDPSTTDPLMCDSIAVHILSAGETRYRTEAPVNDPIRICASDTATYLWREKYKISTDGVYYDTFISPIGCDSIVKAHILVIPTTVVWHDTIVYCQEHLPFQWNNWADQPIIKIPGMRELQHITIDPSTNCPKIDSVIFIGKEIDKKFYHDTICESELPYPYGNTFVTAQAPFPKSITVEIHDPKSDTGCDSMTVTSFVILPTTTTTIYDTICEYDLPNFVWNGLTAEDLDYQELRDTIAFPNPKIDKLICDSVTVLKLTVQRNPSIEKQDISCHQANDGKAWITVPENFGAYSYLWDDPNAQITQTATNLSGGDYSVTIFHDRCPITLSTTIVDPTPVVATIFDHTSVLCYNGNTGTATAQASGGNPQYSYQWNDAQGQITSVATNLYTGTYQVTVTDANNCKDSTTIFIPQPDKLVLQTSSDSVVCFGESNGKAYVVVQGGIQPYLYGWNDPNNQTTSMAEGLSSSDYIVTITDSNNCQETALVFVPQPDPLILTPTHTDVNCFGENNGSAGVVVHGGSAPYTFLWTDPNAQTTENATMLFAGTYHVTVKDKNLCTTTEEIIVEEPDKLILLPSHSDVICFGESNGTATITPQGGTFPYFYQWNDPNLQTTQTASGLLVGNYQVIVTDDHGCQETESITIQEPDLLMANISAFDDVFCFGDSTGSATAVASGGVDPYFYQWNDDSGQTTATATTLPIGTYVATITDYNNCTATTSITIAQPDKIILQTDYDSVICFGENNGKAHVVVQGGIQPYLYEWNDPNNQTTSVAENLFSQEYKVTVTDSNNCQETAFVFVPQPEKLMIQSSQVNVNCFGENNGSIQVVPSGGTPEYTYQWSTNPQQTTASIHELVAGTYKILVLDRNLCQTRDTITITEPDKLILTVSQDTIICPHDFASLTGTYTGGTNPVNIDWGNGLTTWNILTQPTKDSVYMATIIDSHQCTDSAKVTVQVRILPTPNFTKLYAEGCPPVSVQFDNLSTGIFSHCQWSFSDGIGYDHCGSVYHTINTIGYHHLTLTLYTAEGCHISKTDSNVVYTEPWPIASFHTDNIEYSNINTEVNFTNTSSYATQYEWDFGDGSLPSTLVHPMHIYPDIVGNDYQITLIANNDIGCFDTTMTIIRITEAELIWVPNTFTPDDDLHNHSFLPILSSGLDLDSYQLDIFDRWGEIIFTTTNVNQAWDGTYKGIVQQSGVYTWKISVRAKNSDERRQYVGMVTLLK